MGVYYIRIARQVVLNLIGEVENTLVLTGESFNELEMLPIVTKANWQMLLCCFYLFKLMLAYLFKNYKNAIAYANLSQLNISSVLGMMMDFKYNFYCSLTLIKQCDLLAQNNLDIVEANQKLLEFKAFHAPIIFQHKYELVKAEKARVLGRNAVAIEYY